MDETLQIALAAARILDDLGVRWFLGGSLASSLLGVPRATLDADIVADLAPVHVRPLLHALGDAWYADESAIRDAIQRRSCFNLIHLGSAMKVDVFVPKGRPFDKLQFARAKRMPVTVGSDLEIPVCTPEDIVAAKLEWYALGGRVSDRQWNDILGVLRLNTGKLDLAYLRTRAAELQVSDLLDLALGSL